MKLQPAKKAISIDLFWSYILDARISLVLISSILLIPGKHYKSSVLSWKFRLEKIWHIKEIFIGFHCNFDWTN